MVMNSFAAAVAAAAEAVASAASEDALKALRMLRSSLIAQLHLDSGGSAGSRQRLAEKIHLEDEDSVAAGSTLSETR